jgi:hypothetical protein
MERRNPWLSLSWERQRQQPCLSWEPCGHREPRLLVLLSLLVDACGLGARYDKKYTRDLRKDPQT